jgi:hypothetical protein
MYGEDGKVKTGRDGEPILRNPPGTRKPMPTPCRTCPRESPEREAETTLSKKNWAAYETFLRVRATHGAYLHGPRATDELTAELLSLIDAVVRDHEMSMAMQASNVGSLRMIQQSMGG